jgi:hypothetical protein
MSPLYFVSGVAGLTFRKQPQDHAIRAEGQIRRGANLTPIAAVQ